MSTFDGQTIEASGVTKLEATRRGTISHDLVCRDGRLACQLGLTVGLAGGAGQLANTPRPGGGLSPAM